MTALSRRSPNSFSPTKMSCGVTRSSSAASSTETPIHFNQPNLPTQLQTLVLQNHARKPNVGPNKRSKHSNKALRSTVKVPGSRFSKSFLLPSAQTHVTLQTSKRNGSAWLPKAIQNHRKLYSKGVWQFHHCNSVDVICQKIKRFAVNHHAILPRVNRNRVILQPSNPNDPRNL